jgi:hypothetical protein
VEAAVNGIGAVATGVVVLTAAITNFVRFDLPIVPGLPLGWWGAWLVLVVVPAFIVLFLKVHQHYDEVSARTALPPRPGSDRTFRHAMVVPIARLDRPARPAVRAPEYARTLAPNVTAVHVAVDEKLAEGVERARPACGRGIPLVVVESPYRTLTRPLHRFLSEVKRAEQADIVTVVVTVVLPEYVPDSWWEHFLHNQAALLLKAALLFAPGFAVVSIPCHEQSDQC